MKENRYKVTIETETRIITIYTKAPCEKSVARKAMLNTNLNYFDIEKMTIEKG
jgi:hypothetical protein